MELNQRHRRQLSIWLVSCLVFLLFIVAIGGTVRLTRSGLSMVEWKPVTGIVPPFTQQKWQETFEKYKEYPEYKNLKRGMSLNEYKFIYWWEFLHRIAARLIGLLFFIPFLIFLFQKKIPKKFIKHMLFIFFLGGLQGFIGWYMVQSGLSKNPSVSHYRLALHLSLAYFIISYILWLLLDMYSVKDRGQNERQTGLVRFNIIILLVLSLQIVYGAFTAGLKAGFIYNTFPLMGDSFFPDALFESSIYWGGLWGNKAVVQFLHRGLAYLLFVLAIVFFFRLLRTDHSTLQRRLFYSGLVIMLFQVLLGILTILYAVPIWLGVLHQVNAAVLLCSYTASLKILLSENELFI